MCVAGTPVRAQDAPPIIVASAVDGFVNLPEAVRAQVRGMAEALVGTPYTDTAARGLEAEVLALGWFSRATVTSEPRPEGVLLRLTVVENPVVRAIGFPGNTVLPESVLLGAVRTMVGEVMNRNLAAEDARRINREYARRGFTLNEVAEVSITPEGVLNFNIAETRVAEVRIEGLGRTREATVRQEITVKPGDVYNVIAVRESVYRINRLGIFSDVSASVEPGPEPSTVVETYTVVETQTGQVNFGATYSKTGGLSGYVGLTQTNFRGRAEKLQIRVQFGAESAYNITYANPSLNASRASLGLGLYDTDSLRAATLGGTQYQYRESRRGGFLTLGKPTGRSSSGSVTFRADNVESRPDDNVVPPVLITSYDVRSMAFAAQRDTRDALMDPTRGTYRRASLEIAGFGGVSYLQGQLDTRGYRPVARITPEPLMPTTAKRRPVLLATRLMIGATSDATPFPDQFFLGGALMLRGYEEEEFVGNRVLYTSTELRVPVSSTLEVVGFVDAGDAWGGPYGTAYADPDFTLHASLGAGIRLRTPVGPFRLEYAVNSNGGSQLHFGIGVTF
jgi:outer membrane protein insertion porin family